MINLFDYLHKIEMIQVKLQSRISTINDIKYQLRELNNERYSILHSIINKRYIEMKFYETEMGFLKHSPQISHEFLFKGFIEICKKIKDIFILNNEKTSNSLSCNQYYKYITQIDQNTFKHSLCCLCDVVYENKITSKSKINFYYIFKIDLDQNYAIETMRIYDPLITGLFNIESEKKNEYIQKNIKLMDNNLNITKFIENDIDKPWYTPYSQILKLNKNEDSDFSPLKLYFNYCYNCKMHLFDEMDKNFIYNTICGFFIDRFMNLLKVIEEIKFLYTENIKLNKFKYNMILDIFFKEYKNIVENRNLIKFYLIDLYGYYDKEIKIKLLEKYDLNINVIDSCNYLILIKISSNNKNMNKFLIKINNTLSHDCKLILVFSLYDVSYYDGDIENFTDDSLIPINEYIISNYEDDEIDKNYFQLISKNLILNILKQTFLH